MIDLARIDCPLFLLGGTQAAKALAASMPLLAMAKGVEVIVIREETNNCQATSSPSIVNNLARHVHRGAHD